MQVAALRRMAEQAGAFATILRRGDDGAGVILVQLQCRGAAPEIWERLPDLGSNGPSWQRSGPVGPSGDADSPDAVMAWMDRRISRDCDMWIVELDGPDLQSLRALITAFS